MKNSTQWRQQYEQTTAELVKRRTAKLVGEWQQRGPETHSGLAIRKLRLVLAPPQSVITPTPVGAG